MEEEKEALESIKALFKDAFIRNSYLDDESVTNEELLTLEDLSPLEVYENLKDLITNLLLFKENVIKSNTETTSLIKRTEQFENMLQKLEGEVRAHIRTEQQLKLHIETCQCKIDELERKSLKDRQLIETQTQDIEQKAQQIEKLRKEKPISSDDARIRSKDIEDKYKDEISKIATQRKLSLLHGGSELLKPNKEKVASKIKNTHERSEKYAYLRSLLDQKSKECDQLRKDYENSNEKINDIREQHKSKNPISMLHPKFKSMSSRHPGSGGKLSRNSSTKTMCEVIDLFKKSDSAPFFKKETQDNLNSARKKRKEGKHARSNSDNFKAMLIAKEN
ncbi:unnamed protein product [Blepharisma stoltei]|uniref:Uncharacterized protein n=1 Tax=Blepharisma stoltei TaxID=1481888 RepID=A0AAU9JGD3_9CILI|nr:unnamed protein product [Blepharisma stoltei]